MLHRTTRVKWTAAAAWCGAHDGRLGGGGGADNETSVQPSRVVLPTTLLPLIPMMRWVFVSTLTFSPPPPSTVTTVLDRRPDAVVRSRNTGSPAAILSHLRRWGGRDPNPEFSSSKRQQSLPKPPVFFRDEPEHGAQTCFPRATWWSSGQVSARWEADQVRGGKWLQPDRIKRVSLRLTSSPYPHPHPQVVPHLSASAVASTTQDPRRPWAGWRGVRHVRPSPPLPFVVTHRCLEDG
jgi:hypothetical protein